MKIMFRPSKIGEVDMLSIERDVVPQQGDRYTVGNRPCVIALVEWIHDPPAVVLHLTDESHMCCVICGGAVESDQWCREHAPRCPSGAHFAGNCHCQGEL